MAELENIVSVSITAETTTVQTANFNIPLIIAEFNNFTDSRTRTYGSAADVASDFAASSNVYIMAQKVFGQNQKPAQLVVGRKLAAEDYTTAYNAIKQENDEWFGVLAETHVPAQQLLLAAVVEADSKVYITSTQAGDALTTATTDIGSQLKALGYDQTAVIYSANADSQFPEAAWAGSQLTYVPGSNTWKFKSLDGVTVDKLTGTQITNLRAKNINFYISVGGVSITEDGKMASGRWIDEIILVAWTEARMKESVFGMMINQAKVPFTNAGIAMVEAQIRSVLSQGVANGGYSSYTVTSPRLSDIPASRRNGRIAGDFKFRAVLAGAIHQVVIVGTVTTDTAA